jgi:hypothetical protein
MNTWQNSNWGIFHASEIGKKKRTVYAKLDKALAGIEVIPSHVIMGDEAFLSLTNAMRTGLLEDVQSKSIHNYPYGPPECKAGEIHRSVGVQQGFITGYIDVYHVQYQLITKSATCHTALTFNEIMWSRRLAQIL